MNVGAILEHVAELVRDVGRLADAAERIVAALERNADTNAEYLAVVRTAFPVRRHFPATGANERGNE